MIGIIGGSGFYDLIEDVDRTHWAVGTRFGMPANQPVVGKLVGKRVAFLPRHGKDHRFPPHLVPYQANIFSLYSRGVTKIIATSAVGSLTKLMPPGTLVIPDQIVDRTWGRDSTYNSIGGMNIAGLIHPDEGHSHPGVYHLPATHPYSDKLSSQVFQAGISDPTLPPIVHGATVCVINGPRFSTKAESKWYQAQGWELLNMTQAPEAFLAAELGIEYTCIGVVTDYDYGLGIEDAVTHDQVLKVFGETIDGVKKLITLAVEQIDD